MQEAFAITFGRAEDRKGFLAPAPRGQRKFGVAGVGDEYLWNRREEGLKPICKRHALHTKVEEGRSLKGIVAQKEATGRRIRGELTVGRGGFEEVFDQGCGRGHGKQS